jgi:peptidoglycan L-alanyl-D-glutamate endopeptidase CwlK
MALDDISMERLAEVMPELSRRVQQLAAMLSFDIRITQGLRTYAQQDALWQEGRNPDGGYADPTHHVGVVTNAKGGQSMHNFGLAVDVAPIINGIIDWNDKDANWAAILAKAPTCGLAEGAEWRTFPDEPHLYLQELPASPDDALRTIFINGGLQAVFEWASRFISDSSGT